jgi:Mn2+/Fe2+ NRAMP family transporter
LKLKHPINFRLWAGAAFLMATSAIGPGFLTQTAVFSKTLLASFGFAILISVLIDWIIQWQIWHTIIVSGKPAQTVVEEVVPWGGKLLSVIIIVGGWVFNAGNLAGCGLGISVITGWEPWIGSALSAGVVWLIFIYPGFTKNMDRITVLLGSCVLLILMYTLFKTQPPVPLAIEKTFLPDQIEPMIILTLVGGTVGGYISFSGAHRLLQDGIVGQRHWLKARKTALTGLLITAIVRYGFFLAVLGIVAGGYSWNDAQPALNFFSAIQGRWASHFFGIVIWVAAITSVIGCTYTSVSFADGWVKDFSIHRHKYMWVFLVVSFLLLMIAGRPVSWLIYAGTINGMLLPITLIILLIAAKRLPVQLPAAFRLLVFIVALLLLALTVYTLL